MKSTRAALAAAVLAGAMILGACAAPAARQPAGETDPGVSAPAATPDSSSQQENPQMPTPNDQSGAASQGAANPQEAPGLNGTSWTLTDLNGAAPLADHAPTLEFFAEGRVGGMASCNRYTGGYTLDGASVSFSQMGSTMMMCPQEQMEQEQAYLELLQRGASYSIAGDVLTITADDGATLVFARA